MKPFVKYISTVIFIFIIAICSKTYGQPVFTPKNLSLGGGGSTYITDYQANFYNPANLMIRDRRQSFDVGAMIVSFYVDPLIIRQNASEQYDELSTYFKSFTPGSASLSEQDRSQLLDINFGPGDTFTSNRYRSDATLFGIKWEREKRAFSVAVRSRTSTKFESGWNWYSDEAILKDDVFIRDRRLKQRFQSLHEISFGYAESFSFLTDLTPRIDQFIIGIAPKLVFGGDYLNAVWKNEYNSRPEDSRLNRIESLQYSAIGNFSKQTRDFLRNGSMNMSSDYFDPLSMNIEGIGAGLDIGVTYLLTFGNDLSAIYPSRQRTRKSLRLSFSMTDIGFISYNNQGLLYSQPEDTSIVNAAPSSLSDQAFKGIRGQYLYFAESFSGNFPLQIQPEDDRRFSTLLPLAIHTGAMLEWNRLKIMGDLSVGLTKNAFNSTSVLSSFGIEIRPLNILPIRSGIQFDAGEAEFIGFGTGIESKHWNVSIGTQIPAKSISMSSIPSGISFAALSFQF